MSKIENHFDTMLEDTADEIGNWGNNGMNTNDSELKEFGTDETDDDNITIIDNGCELKDTPRKLKRKRVSNHRKIYKINEILWDVEEKE